MTCIVGVRQGGKVFIGGDSAGVAGWEVTIRADPKVFVTGPYIMGFTTSFRLGQLLQHKLKLPDPPRSQSKLYGFMVGEFVEAVRECLKVGGVATKDKEAESGGTFMVGVHGRLFVIADDYQVAEPVPNFAAVGGGAPYALGSLATSKGPPAARVKKALEVAERFCMGVRAPFRILAAP